MSGGPKLGEHVVGPQAIPMEIRIYYNPVTRQQFYYGHVMTDKEIEMVAPPVFSMARGLQGGPAGVPGYTSPNNVTAEGAAPGAGPSPGTGASAPGGQAP